MLQGVCYQIAFNFNVEFDSSGEEDMNLLVAKFWDLLKVGSNLPK